MRPIQPYACQGSHSSISLALDMRSQQQTMRLRLLPPRPRLLQFRRLRPNSSVPSPETTNPPQSRKTYGGGLRGALLAGPESDLPTKNIVKKTERNLQYGIKATS